jgi:PAS domain S-box-containing protein
LRFETLREKVARVLPPGQSPDGATTAADDDVSAREAAERVAFAANALPALLAYLDGDARYVWVNDGYRRWFGRPVETIVGRHVSELLGAAAWVTLRPYVARALAGEEVTFENRLVFEGNPVHDVRVSYVPHREGSGRVRGFVALVSDITATKAVEAALRRSERMLEQAQAAAQVGSWELTYDEKLEEIPGSALWSPETFRILGYPPDTAANLASFRARVHPADREALRALSVRGLQRAERYATEYRIVRPDGTERVLRAWLQFERAPDGKTTRAFGTCQDITERKQGEQEVRRAREQLELVVDSTPAFIAHYDRERRLVWANRSYAARFGKEPKDLVGKRLDELIGEEAFRVFEPSFARAIAGESFQVELEVPYAAGPRFVQVIGAPTRDAAGVPDGATAVLTDLTHRRTLERERERALADLQEANRHKDEFLGMLAHELRNPLAPILNGVEVLESLEPGQWDLAGQYLPIIARQARHMRRLLDDLLDVSRVSQGKIQLHKERVDLNALLQQAIETTRPAVLAKQHTLSLTLAPQAALLDADPTRMVQVFANLISNAAKYTDAGGHITIASAAEPGEAVVTVRDDGVGMTPEMLTRAFDLFVQDTRSLDRAQGGLGIGLTLVRTLVMMHGGSVRAYSDGPGHGCELVVRLPLAAAAAPSPPAPAVGARDRAGVSLRVLIVDDNDDAAAALGHLMGILGHEIALAKDGPAALAAAEAAPPDLILIDIGLPGMDGYQLAARLRAAGHTRAALVAVTGYGREADVRRSREAGFDHHLVKPVELAQLERITQLRA